MELEQARKELMALQEKMSAYEHATALLQYDGDTSAPEGTAANRAHTMAILGEEQYKLAIGAETVQLLEYLDGQQEALTEKEQRMVYLLLKEIRHMQKIPMEEYIAFEKLTVEAGAVWHRAKEENDYASFRPYLDRLIAATTRIAGYCAPEKEPYDYWLDEYEEGMDQKKLDAFFDGLRAHLVPLIQKIGAAEQVDETPLRGEAPEEAQAKLVPYLMDLLGLDRAHVGFTTTLHPFTTSLGSHYDERITTNYKLDNYADSLFSVVHEGGHALYDTGSADDLAYTALDGGGSMGLHESQSRFYENLIGRSRAFVNHIFPKLQELFPERVKGFTAEDVYRAVNRVTPSLIRTESDEVTYCLHIMIRYELEKRLFNGTLSTEDLPAEWNRLYREYLGVEVPDDAHGVLQDVHWSGGGFGYFPSYALGNVYGAALLEKMKETVDVEAAVAAGDLSPVNAWNREHIWQYGKLYPTQKILRDALGQEPTAEAYIRYLETKYSEIYGL